MKKRSTSGGQFVWTSYSDLSTGVMLSFILLLFVFVFLFNKKKEELDDFKTIAKKAHLVDESIRANKKLNQEFAELSSQIEQHGNDKCAGANFQNITKSNALRVQFDESVSWFENGQSQLSSQGVKCLEYFIPYFLNRLYKKDLELNGKISSIIVEGHTNSIPFNGSKDSFFDNLELSQKRSLETVRFIMKTALGMENKKMIPWIKKKLSANGRGFADLLYKNNEEDKVGSKRVEFKFNIDHGIGNEI